MKSKHLLVTFYILSFFLPLSLAAAEQFRCPKSGKIVQTGDNQYEVEAKCGPPSSKTPVSVAVQTVDGQAATTLQVEEWTYDFGPSYFMQILRFENGKLQRITTGDYGRKKDNSQ